MRSARSSCVRWKRSMTRRRNSRSSSTTLPSAAPIPEVPQWTEGPDIGTGVAMKDTGNPRGQSAFIGYAGYSVSIEDAETWVDALYDSWLRDRGVRYVWAVRGPDDSHYEHK